MTSAAPSRTLFFEVSRKALPRLLSQLDRQPFSPSSGSWHRGYWHQRLSDFSSSACQQGMLSLALLYGLEHEGNPLFRHSETLRWIDASIRALLREQHGDGSFDEWYPNERGWAGPTGYVIYALAKTWSLVGSGLEPELGLHVESACKKACAFLGKYEEIDVLANHQAMALLAVAQVRATFGAKLGGLDEAYEDLFRRFALSTRAQEGWSLEYDGADAGYQTASLSFLARVHALTQDERIEKIAGPMVDFVACFFFGEKSFGGVPG
ncbi:MAG: hypothetical protein ACXVCH_17130, partial [Bdellovibrionota bacterium]